MARDSNTVETDVVVMVRTQTFGSAKCRSSLFEAGGGVTFQAAEDKL
jgi:hypothetical protein